MAIAIETKKREDEYNRLSHILQSCSYQCKRCGRKEVIRHNLDRRLCSHCGHYIYKSEELENQYKFKEKLMKEMRKK